MEDVTQILQQINSGQEQAREQLLDAVYTELRQMAAAQMVREKPGQTLQPTALVHEAWLRLMKVPTCQSSPSHPVLAAEHVSNRRYFFAAAAEAMRRILIEQARRKQIIPRDPRHEVNPLYSEDERWMHLADALETLAQSDPSAAELAKLRLLGGVSIEDASVCLGISRATAYREWEFARAWLSDQLRDHNPEKCEIV
jgi:RNA polymerase sigma factor (TIGR02999 family)